MSGQPVNRSRSPKTDKGNDTLSMADNLWAAIEPKIDQKNSEFKDDVKNVVGSLVNQQIERLEKKISENQQTNSDKMQSLEEKVDAKFADLETNLLKAIQASNHPPPSQGTPSASGGSVAPTFTVKAATDRFDARPGGSGSPAPIWVADVTTPLFNRPPNATKLFCNIHDKVQVSKSKFRESVVTLVLEAGLKEQDFAIVGDVLDFRFELQFSGDNGIAAVKAQQFHQSLQLGRGKWKPQLVEDSLGAEHKFYVNPDKNPAQMRKEVLAKRLQAILSPICIDKQFFVKKSSGTIYTDRRVLVSVVLTGEDSARLVWCHPKRIECHIDQAAVEEAFGHYVLSGGQFS